MYDKDHFQRKVYEYVRGFRALATDCRLYAMIYYFVEEELAPGDRVLEIGYGRGSFLSFLAEQDYTVHGLDIGGEANEAAAELAADPRLSNVRIGSIFSRRGQRSIEKSIQKDGKFAAVLSRSLLVWSALGFRHSNANFRDLMDIIAPYSDLFLHQTYDVETLITEETIRSLPAYDGFEVVEARHPGPFLEDQTLYVLSRRPAIT